MLEAIIGKNASGKSVVLKKQLKDLVDSGKTVATNLIESELLEDTGISCSSLELLNHIVELDTFKILGNNIVYEDQGESHSKDFLELVNIICKDVDVIVIDEPETGLTEREAYFSGILMNQVSKTKDIIITTHKDDFYWFDSCITYIVNREGKHFRKVRYTS